VVTNLPQELIGAAELYETHYRAREEMENRIKEQQLYLFSDRTSSATERREAPVRINREVVGRVYSQERIGEQLYRAVIRQ